MVLQQKIEKVQNRAARFVSCNCCFETVSMTGILKKENGSLSRGEERQ